MPFLVEKLSGLKNSGHISPRSHVAVAFLPIPMFLISFLAVLTSISSCCRPASWEILPQEHGRIGLQAGKEGRGDAQLLVLLVLLWGGEKEMQSRLVSKSDFIAWHTFTLNFISASKVENKCITVSPVRRFSFFRDGCELPCETQELSGSSSPPCSTLSLWQTGRSEHENWIVGQCSSDRIKTVLNVEGAAAWWDCICALYSSSWVFSTFIWTMSHFFACSPHGSSLCRSFCCRFLSLLCRVSRHPPPLHRPWLSGSNPPFPFHAGNAVWSRSSQRRGGESDLWAAAHLKPPQPARIIPISWRMAGEGSLADWAKAELPVCLVPGFRSQNEVLLENCKEA